MSIHYCKIGQICPKFIKLLNSKDLEKRYHQFMEAAYNWMHTDANISDMLYYEASKIKRQIMQLKQWCRLKQIEC